MTFKELMNKLNIWILNTWNKSNPKNPVNIKPTDAHETQYNITPLSSDYYMLMFFKQVPGEPPYLMDIEIDNCKSYFGGIDKFQIFLDDVNRLLKSSHSAHFSFAVLIPFLRAFCCSPRLQEKSIGDDEEQGRLIAPAHFNCMH